MSGRVRIEDIQGTEVHKIAAQLLIERGFITEFDAYPKSIIENDTTKIEEIVRRHGYEGGQLETTAPELGQRGWIWVLYDSERFTPAQIESMV
jgi:hypothetical protein